MKHLLKNNDGTDWLSLPWQGTVWGLCILLLTAFCALADEPSQQKKKTERPGATARQTAVQTFRKWDSNNDGQLSENELPKFARANFARVDRNGDKSISLNEHIGFFAKKPGSTRTLPPGVDVKRNLAYVKDGHERQVLDLYLPAESTGPRPLVIWIHGGGWRQGTKDNCPAVPLVDRGFVVASINYRLSHQAIFPAQIHDCKAAIRWLHANSKRYGIEPTKIGVWGSSAGGHLAALVGTSGDVLLLEPAPGNRENSSRVQAVCDWFGPTDLLLMNEQAGGSGKMDHNAPNSPESLLLGGTLQTVAAKARIASPLTYVTSDDPAFLIVHGNQDPLVHWKQSQILHDALRAAGCQSDLRIVPDAGHGRFKDAAITEDCFRFFETVLK